MQLRDVDPITRAEVKRFAELKYDEQMKFKGQIARDLKKFGEYGFMQASAYTALKQKYLRAHAGKKKLV